MLYLLGENICIGDNVRIDDFTIIIVLMVKLISEIMFMLAHITI